MGIAILPFVFAKTTDKLKFASYLSICVFVKNLNNNNNIFYSFLKSQNNCYPK